ncbi:unnamed protein product [Paramecium sonneborni]|uniref:Serine/threonine protein kinase n=1 Tax=Paramecium sonneborni TaxID=65129 RepID=A0A8S1R9X6_9CILI|nr:unnamed protein product [Paramecium sonneborni]
MYSKDFQIPLDYQALRESQIQLDKIIDQIKSQKEQQSQKQNSLTQQKFEFTKIFQHFNISISPIKESDNESKVKNQKEQEVERMIIQKADELKKKGNEYYFNANYQQATIMYTEALQLIQDNVILWLNRAISYIKLEQYNQAIGDCSKVLEIANQGKYNFKDNSDNYFKAYLRRAFAYFKINQYENALSDIKQALIIDPKNQEAENLKTDVERQLFLHQQKQNNKNSLNEVKKKQIDSDLNYKDVIDSFFLQNENFDLFKAFQVMQKNTDESAAYFYDKRGIETLIQIIKSDEETLHDQYNLMASLPALILQCYQEKNQLYQEQFIRKYNGVNLLTQKIINLLEKANQKKKSAIYDCIKDYIDALNILTDEKVRNFVQMNPIFETKFYSQIFCPIIILYNTEFELVASLLSLSANLCYDIKSTLRVVFYNNIDEIINYVIQILENVKLSQESCNLLVQLFNYMCNLLIEEQFRQKFINQNQNKEFYGYFFSILGNVDQQYEELYQIQLGFLINLFYSNEIIHSEQLIFELRSLPKILESLSHSKNTQILERIEILQSFVKNLYIVLFKIRIFNKNIEMQYLTRPQQQLQEIVQQNNLRAKSFNPNGLMSLSPIQKTNQSIGLQGIDFKQIKRCQGEGLKGKQYKKELLKLMSSHQQLSTLKQSHKNNISDTQTNLKTITIIDTRRTTSNQLQKSLIQIIQNQSIVNQIFIVIHYQNQKYKFIIDAYKNTGYLMDYLKQEMKKHLIHQNIQNESQKDGVKIINRVDNENMQMEIVIFHTIDKNLPIDFYIQQLDKPLDIFSGQTLNLQPFYGIDQGFQLNLKDFIFIKCIGIGGFSRVYLVRKKLDGRFYAMKLIDKEFILLHKKQGIVQNERDIMTVLDHPFINKLDCAFESKNFIVFVLEFCSGGELFWQLRQVKRMNEEQARFYFAEICLAICYLHQLSIVYRDIKPENVLIDMDGHIRIADFGLSKPNMTEEDYAYSFCGSPEYMAPEMLLNVGHNLQVDHYCLGALLYELVIGIPPYYSKNTEEIYQSILTEELTFPNQFNLTDQIKDLLKGLLCKRPQSRLGSQNGLQELMLHPWFKDFNWILILNKKIQPPFQPNQLQFHYDSNELLKGELETRDKILGKTGLQENIKIFKSFYFDSKKQKQMKIEQNKILKQHFKMISQIQMQLTQKYKPQSPESRYCNQKQYKMNTEQTFSLQKRIKSQQSSFVQPFQTNTLVIPQQSKLIGLKKMISQNNLVIDRLNTSPTSVGYHSKDKINQQVLLQNGVSITNLQQRGSSLKQRKK